MHEPSSELIQDVTDPRRRRLSALAILTAASWVAAIATWFFINVLWAWLWVLAIGFIGMVGMICAGLTVGWAVRSMVHRRYVLAVAIAGVAAMIGLITLRVPWEEAYPRIWFTLHRDAFVQAEAMVRSGALDPTNDYYGAELPPDIAAISISGRLSSTTTWADPSERTPCDEPIEFAPAAIGTPDGGVGFIHLPCESPPAGFEVNGFDDAIIPRIRLGDGWWWADGRSP